MIDVPMLSDDNHQEWKDVVLLHLGLLEMDFAIHNKEPAPITNDSSEADKKFHSQWIRSNRLCVYFIKTRIPRSIRGSIDHCDKVEPLFKAIDDQFSTSNKALASTLIMKFVGLRLSTIKGTRKHIMQVRDIAAQLNKLDIILPDTFVVHFALNSLPQHYSPFKIFYNTHKDKWSINDLITMCTRGTEAY
ncbi:PREDICTED: uncharacterized protein LOC109163853 [Ipomoea nil]|uniref:uncharacterized protein LOC109163853 n=1 Tax=Ipomoea nil TaxID=35883 RepID=UPI00090188C7|nr:PREDICTED: uncharacterized protein LOC109163853 [Ipomoea nil]